MNYNDDGARFEQPPQENHRNTIDAQDVMVLSGAGLVGELALGAAAFTFIGQEKLEQLPILQNSYMCVLGVTIVSLCVSTFKHTLNQSPTPATIQNQYPESPTSETE